MRNLVKTFLIILLLASVARGAVVNSNGTGGGDWSVGASWNGGVVPADTEGFSILAGDDITDFDVDQTAWAGMAASTIAATGSLTIKDDAGDYVLKMAGDITLAGTMQAGTSVAIPLTGTFAVNYSAGSHSILINDTTGSLLLYCGEPTTKYVSLTAANSDGTVADPLDVDGDISSDWTVGDTVAICDLKTPSSSAYDNEIDTIAAMTSTTITLTGGLDSQVEIGGVVVLVSRNIRLFNSTDYAIKEGSTGTNEIYAEIYDCTGGGILNTANATIGGCIAFVAASEKYGLRSTTGCTANIAIVNGGNNSNYGVRADNIIIEDDSVICGHNQNLSSCYNMTSFAYLAAGVFGAATMKSVSYTHLTLPTIYSV